MKLQKHPLNTDFEWPDVTGPFRLITQEQADAYNRQGFFVLESAFNPADIEHLTQIIDGYEQKTEAFLREQKDGKMFISRADDITFSAHIAMRESWIGEFATNQVFQDLMHDLIGAKAMLYWDQAVYKKPDTTLLFPWHQDNGYTYIEPQTYVTCWLALTDANENNGCPWLMPGQHREGTLNHKIHELGLVCAEDPVDNAVCVPVKAGDIAVFSSLTPHKTGPNLTEQTRKTYILQYSHQQITRAEKQGDSYVRHDATNLPNQIVF
ncbi:MAG: phytanoyl-CoA dioxygenase family protein [Pseudomonadota bacterium]